VTIWVNCAAEHLCCVAILNPFQESYLLWRANNLFRGSQNEYHDKLLRENSLQQGVKLHLHIICINFQVVFFVDTCNFQEFATFTTVYEETSKLHIFYWIKARVFLKRNSFIREDAAFCFAIYLVLHSPSQSCHTTWFSLAVRHSFLKELEIAKTAKNIWTTGEINLAKLSSM